MEISRQSIYELMDRLKNNLRKEMVAGLVGLTVIVFMMMGDPVNYDNVLIYIICPLCFLMMIIHYWTNIKIIRSLESQGMPVKKDLEKHVISIERNLHFYSFFFLLLVFLFVLINELNIVFQFLQQAPFAQNWIYRISIYGLLTALVIYLHYVLLPRRYGTHLDEIKKLLKQMD